MENPAKIARNAGFEIDTPFVAAFELCFDIYGEGRLLATLFYDGKPRNAFTEPLAGDDAPVGWCIQFSDELDQGVPVLWCIAARADRLDLATAMACGMVQQRLMQEGWWQPLPDNRVWDEGEPTHVKEHQRIQIDDVPVGS